VLSSDLQFILQFVATDFAINFLSRLGIASESKQLFRIKNSSKLFFPFKLIIPLRFF
jgi:hypothetical protein